MVLSCTFKRITLPCVVRASNETYAKHFFGSCRRRVTLGDWLQSLWTDDETLAPDRKRHFLSCVRRSNLKAGKRRVFVFGTVRCCHKSFSLFIYFFFPSFPYKDVFAWRTFLFQLWRSFMRFSFWWWGTAAHLLPMRCTLSLYSFETQKLSAVFLGVERNVSHPSLQTPCLWAAHRPCGARERERKELLKSFVSIRDAPGNKIIFTERIQ